ncbi:MAG: class I SAM-dependent methyltransferase [Nitrosospira sp.]|nr:class I SAM-dependent methyltransferase [Nitrosospira sp.]
MIEQELRNLGLSDRECFRLSSTFELIPPDARTALEIGFYDLRVTRLLRKRLSVVSVDLPRPVSAEDKSGLVFADIQALPFPSKTFDVVFCTEVLEHLPEGVLEHGVRELVRVARKSLIVSVPFQQRVWNEMFKCEDCGFTGHSMGHLHYFTEEDITRLFPQYNVVERRFIGTSKGYAPDWLYGIARKYGNVWGNYQFGNCPQCGRTDRAVPPNWFGRIIERVIWRAHKHAPTQPSWLLMSLAAA